MNKLIIGRKEKINFPQWKYKNLVAKIDTGAYTSSINSEIIDSYVKDNVEYVKFLPKVFRTIIPRENIIELPISKKKNVKSSNGQTTERYFVILEIELGGKKREIEFSLHDRKNMKYTILLGRKFLNELYIVDVSQKYLLH